MKLKEVMYGDIDYEIPFNGSIKDVFMIDMISKATQVSIEYPFIKEDFTLLNQLWKKYQ